MLARQQALIEVLRAIDARVFCKALNCCDASSCCAADARSPGELAMRDRTANVALHLDLFTPLQRT
jgi:hypothetical protein